MHDEAMAEDPPHLFELCVEEEKLPPSEHGYDGGWLLRDPVFGIVKRGSNCPIAIAQLKEKVLNHIHNRNKKCAN